MDATVKVIEGSVRVYDLNLVPDPGDGFTRRPYMDAGAGGDITVTGNWAIGQVPFEPNGTFSITAGTAGTLRIFDEYIDEHGNVAPSNDSTNVEVQAGETQDFKTTNSNAFKVSTGA